MRFVLIDRLVSLDRARHARAVVAFDPALPIFADHFPGRPIVPGTLLTEAMAQTAGWLIAASIDFAGWPLLVTIDRARFHRPVAPGVELMIDATIRSAREDAWEVVARTGDGSATAAEARLLFHRFDVAGGSAAADWTRATFARLDGPAALAAGVEQTR